MTAVTNKPKTRLVYFAVFWLCRELLGAAEDRLPSRTEGGGGNVCCSGGAPTPCPKNSGSGKKCDSGKSCSNPRCDDCRPVPKCKEGEELQYSGTIDFTFYCKECPRGTFLDGKSGCCIAWADCSKNGLQTIQPGNRTHNVQCGVPSTVDPDSTFTNVTAIVTAAGIFLVILMMVFLLLLMWVQKREKLPIMEGLEASNDSNLERLPQQHEESFSCLYPEEERGHKMAEERDSMPFLAH